MQYVRLLTSSYLPYKQFWNTFTQIATILPSFNHCHVKQAQYSAMAPNDGEASSSLQTNNNTLQHDTPTSNSANENKNKNKNKNNTGTQKQKSKNTKGNRNAQQQPRHDSQPPNPSTRPAKRPPLTHFLCIPLVTPESRPLLEESLRKLHDKVISVNAAHLRSSAAAPPPDATHTTDGDKEHNSENHRESLCWIPEDAIRPLGTLHLTLGVMNLGPEGSERHARAITTLQSLDLRRTVRDLQDLQDLQEAEGEVKGQGASKKPSDMATICSNPASELTVTLQSLHPMGSAKNTSVLYAFPAAGGSTSLLLSFCEAVRRIFWDAGLLEESSGKEGNEKRGGLRPLRLHATIVNTIYARGTVPEEILAQREGRRENKGSVQRKYKAKGMKMDARGWKQQYEGHIWVKNMPLEKLSICKMAAEKVEGGDGARYKEIAAVGFIKE